MGKVAKRRNRASSAAPRMSPRSQPRGARDAPRAGPAGRYAPPATSSSLRRVRDLATTLPMRSSDAQGGSGWDRRTFVTPSSGKPSRVGHATAAWCPRLANPRGARPASGRRRDRHTRRETRNDQQPSSPKCMQACVAIPKSPARPHATRGAQRARTPSSRAGPAPPPLYLTQRRAPPAPTAPSAAIAVTTEAARPMPTV